MPERQRVLIFANPIAGRGQGATIARRLKGRLNQSGLDVETFFEPPDCFDLNRLAQPVRAAVVIGGDGTLRAVAHRLFLDPCEPGPTGAPTASGQSTEPPLLIVPLGTANLMGRHLGIRWKDQTLENQVALAIERHRVVRLDTARANGRLFLLMAGVGFDAHVVHELDRLRRGPIRFASYIAPAFLALQNYAYPPIRVTVDSRDLFGPEPAVAFVGNLPEYGTGFPILPRARADDGVLDVCVLPCRSVQDLVRLFLMAASGEHLQAEGVAYAKGRHVRITAADGAAPVPVQVDGDPAGHAPVEIDLLPIRLPFIVPAAPGQ
jgi:diacylglycerol kinase (ATP)